MSEKLKALYSSIMAQDGSFLPDTWQKQVLAHSGNVCIRAGRQVGKSVVIARKAAQFALQNDNTVTLVIAAAQRQSSYIFEKILNELQKVNEQLLKEAGGFRENKGASRRSNIIQQADFEREHGLFESVATKTEINLKNGSRIYSLPVGKSGIYIKGLTIDLLIADEAAYIPEVAWIAVTPMVAVSQKKGLGWIILLSTPFGKGGYFYNCSHDKDFLQIHKSSEDCPRISREFLRKERARLTKAEYAQEYLGEFVDDWNQFFSTDLIKKSMTFIGWNFEKEYSRDKSYYMGMDIAKYGEDETAICILEMDASGHCRIVRVDSMPNMKITESARMAERLDIQFRFKAVFVDNQGLGEGVLDLLREGLGKSKVVGLNNASKAVDVDERRYKKLLKEDLYSNALKMLELGEVELISDLDLMRSLKCMQFEYTSEQNLRIFGGYSHLSEAFVRACWAKREKKLRLFIA